MASKSARARASAARSSARDGFPPRPARSRFLLSAALALALRCLFVSLAPARAVRSCARASAIVSSISATGMGSPLSSRRTIASRTGAGVEGEASLKRRAQAMWKLFPNSPRTRVRPASSCKPCARSIRIPIRATGRNAHDRAVLEHGSDQGRARLPLWLSVANRTESSLPPPSPAPPRRCRASSSRTGTCGRRPPLCCRPG